MFPVLATHHQACTSNLFWSAFGSQSFLYFIKTNMPGLIYALLNDEIKYLWNVWIKILCLLNLLNPFHNKVYVLKTHKCFILKKKLFLKKILLIISVLMIEF